MDAWSFRWGRIGAFVVVGAVVVAAAAGCGGSGSELAGAGPSSTSSSPAPSSPVPSSSSSQPAGVTTSKPMTLTGVLERGAEPSCLILKAGRSSYELQGPLAARLRVNAHVRLVGHTVSGVASHCMQGTPFVVTSVSSP
jgi:hypothetical protein